MNRIKFLREDLDITQQDLANKLDCSKSVIGLYENNRRKPSLEVLVKLSEIFNCSIDYILGKSDIRSPKNDNDDILDLAKVGFTKENYNPPTEKQKEQIRTIIETILADNKKDNKRDDSNK